MVTRIKIIDHAPPPLLPSDLHDWMRATHIAHFVMDAVAALRKLRPTAPATHFPGWGWTTAMAVAAAVLYAGVIALRSPQTSDFIYFQF